MLVLVDVSACLCLVLSVAVTLAKFLAELLLLLDKQPSPASELIYFAIIVRLAFQLVLQFKDLVLKLQDFPLVYWQRTVFLPLHRFHHIFVHVYVSNFLLYETINLGPANFLFDINLI